MDGRSYTPPAPSADNKMMPRPRSFAASPHQGQEEWDDWGGSGAGGGGGHGGGSLNAGQRSGSEYTMSQLQVRSALFSGLPAVRLPAAVQAACSWAVGPWGWPGLSRADDDDTPLLLAVSSFVK